MSQVGRKVVRKFPLPRNPGMRRVQMYEGDTVLGVQIQHGNPVIYAEGKEKASPKDRTFYVAETGQEVPDSFTFRGTVMLDLGTYVLHIYEAKS